MVFHPSFLNINNYINQKCINPTIIDLKLLTFLLNTLNMIENIKLFGQNQIYQGSLSCKEFSMFDKMCY